MSAIRYFLLLLLCLSLSPPGSLSLTEVEALMTFKNSMSNTESLHTWKPDSNPCNDKWAGVFCAQGKPEIIRLHLTKMNLSGNIDVNSLLEIKNLISLSLSNNSFEGSLPPFNKLKGLKALYVSANRFSGEIPADFFAETSLRRLWLSDNEFSGKIPESLGKMVGLTALHLERNKFTGPIPDISQISLTELDMSGNQLEGQVPASMERFGENAFKDNSGVCGKLVGKECTQAKKGNMKFAIGLMVGVLVIMISCLVISALMRSKERNSADFHRLDKQPMDDVEVQSQGRGRSGGGSNRNIDNGLDAGGAGAGGSSKRSNNGTSQKKSQQGKNAGVGDLTMINNEKGQFGLADLMKASAEALGNGALGSAYKAVMSNGVAVVVKRIKEMNKLKKDEFDAEIRRFAKFRHKNILKPLAYHYRKEEKLLVSEHIPKGSLLYVLHGDKGPTHAELNWPTRLKIIKGIASGLQYLYKELSDYDLPHGNLKASNIFLSANNEPLLADYGFFRMVAPVQAAQGMFAYKAPESIETLQVSSKGDVYCLGIVILEVLTGKLPSQYLNAGKGGTDVIQLVQSAIENKKEAQHLDPEIASSTNSVQSMIQLLHLGSQCTETKPDKRPTMQEAIKRIEEIHA